ncbi:MULTISPECIES: hypothetical protein [Gluconobacter]|uniref:Uncharacterized protein n=1 Tax=Gluconobacter oxydans NBRC 3293 TaxID=1315969 RepID=A0A829WZN5_GLUOY|nr:MULTISPECIES: hypothetical protein [Gluconobacter]GAP26014.1 hypothetical protein GLF_2896 [Gluconobacter frateurii NBRC 101659]GEM18533.1 hypothetical protein NBRC3293_3030 [Gluconobacter oxydans NBRC 3293]
MDNVTQSILFILLPAAAFTIGLGLAIGPIASRLAKLRTSHQ